MEGRRIERRTFTYYMQVLDASTAKLMGHLSDISAIGFKLDCQAAVPLGKDFQLYINLSKEIADKTTMSFIARSKWCKQDPIDPTTFVVGFQLINISPGDQAIFQRMFEKYGKK